MTRPEWVAGRQLMDDPAHRQHGEWVSCQNFELGAIQVLRTEAVRCRNGVEVTTRGALDRESLGAGERQDPAVVHRPSPCGDRGEMGLPFAAEGAVHLHRLWGLNDELSVAGALALFMAAGYVAPARVTTVANRP